MIEEFRAARKVSVPIMAITTADQLATTIAVAQNARKDKEAVIRWDTANGAFGMDISGTIGATCLGEKVLAEIWEDDRRPTMRLSNLLSNPDIAHGHGLIILVLNAQRFLDDPINVQAVCNARNAFSQQGSCIVLLGPSFDFPPEIGADILVIDEPLPSRTEVATIMREVLADTHAITVTDDDVTKGSEALTGLSTFAVEQATALSIVGGAFDLDELWQRKRDMINATNGLSVYEGPETFADIGGVMQIKKNLNRLLAGPASPNCIVFMDEIEKAIGTDMDTSGVSQSLLGTMLTWMQNRKANGMIFIGPPGAAKSVVAKATGNEAGIPTIEFDLSGMKGSLVGQSEANLRNALKVVDAVSQGKVLVLATCNKLTNLPPELRRRFKKGTYFFDLPNAEERATIWPIHIARCGVNDAYTFDDNGWTGAEIEAVCENARDMDYTLDEAAETIVPVSVSAEKAIEQLRKEAHDRFLSASYPGPFDIERNKVARPARRKLDIGG